MTVWIIILIFLLILFAAFYLKKRKKKVFYQTGRKNIKIDKKLNLKEGDFIIKGKRDKFKICKNGRYTFEVVDGQIESITDISTKKKYLYGGDIIGMDN